MKKFERKDFLKISGGAIVGGAVGATLAGGPFDAYQWAVEWTQDQLNPPRGEEQFLRTVCDICPDQCNLNVRMISDRAVKIETGNSGCPMGQNALQLLYHPERIQQPLKRVGTRKGRDNFEPVSWEVALKEIAGKITEKIEGDKRHLIASINKNYGQSSSLLDRLMKAVGSNNSYYEQSLESSTKAALGGTVNYNFETTDYILSFGSRLLEGWGNQSTIMDQFKDFKKGNRNTKLVQIDATNTQTASLADEWVPVKPGTEIFLALGIARYLIREKRKTSRGTGFGRWSSRVNHYTLDRVSTITGVPAEKIQEIGDAFARAARPMAVAGRGAKGVSSSSAEIQAVYALNSLVNTSAVSVSGIGEVGNVPMSQGASASAQANAAKKGIDEFIKDGSFEMMFINEADPVYKSVYGKELQEKLNNAFVVSIAPLKNNTALYADYILPSLSFLEMKTSAGDPAVDARYNSKPAAQIILDIASGVEEISGAFPWTNYENANVGGGTGAAQLEFDTEALRDQSSKLTKLLEENADFPFLLIPTEVSVMGDGDGAAFPYTYKAIDDFTYSDVRSWGNFVVTDKLWVHINRQTAEEQGISEGECLEIESSRGEISSVYAHLTDTVAPKAVSIPLGFGHTCYTSYAADKGVNPKEIMFNEIDLLSGTADWWTTRVKLS